MKFTNVPHDNSNLTFKLTHSSQSKSRSSNKQKFYSYLKFHLSSHKVIKNELFEILSTSQVAHLCNIISYRPHIWLLLL